MSAFRSASSGSIYRPPGELRSPRQKKGTGPFNQRIHYIALSIAFALTAVTSYSTDLLFQAGFIPQFPATGLWALMVAVWFITMIVTPRFYR